MRQRICFGEIGIDRKYSPLREGFFVGVRFLQTLQANVTEKSVKTACNIKRYTNERVVTFLPHCTNADFMPCNL
jgi:hypothetical protein